MLSVLVAAVSAPISTILPTLKQQSLLTSCDSVYSKCEQHTVPAPCVVFCEAIVTLDEELCLADVLNQEQDMNACIFRKFKIAAFTFVKQKLPYHHHSSLSFRTY